MEKDTTRFYATFTAKASETSDGRRIIEGIASTVTPDRVNDVIVPKGGKYTIPIPLLLHHDRTLPVGEIFEVKVDDTQIRIKAEIAKDTGLQYVEDGWKQLKSGLIRGLSVGIRSVEGGLEFLKNGGIKFNKWTWLELSAVTIPQNAEATIIAIKAASASGNARAQLSKNGNAVNAGGKSNNGKSAANTRTKTMSGIGEKIDTLGREVVELQDSVNEVIKACETEGREPSEDEQALVETAKSQIDTKNKALSMYKSAEEALAAKAFGNKGTPGVIAHRSKSREKGDFLFKLAAATLIQHHTREPILQVIEKSWARDAEAIEVLKVAVDPATTTTAGWAAELVQTDVQGFLDLMIETSVFPQLAARGIQLNFNGLHSIKIPSRTTTARAPGSFVGEGLPIPVKKISLTSQTLVNYKMAVISTFTKEIFTQSVPQIEALLRRSITDDTGETLDTLALDATAIQAGVRPAGLQDGAVTAASAGATLANIITDVKAMIASMLSAKGGRDLVWLLNPARVLGLSLIQATNGEFMFRDELGRGLFFGYPVIVSGNVPSAVVFLIDAADFAAALDAPAYDVSEQATIVEADDGADPAVVTVDVAAHDVAAPAPTIRSLWQTNTIGLRMLLPVTWAMARASHVVTRTACSW